MEREREGHWFVILDSTTGKHFYANPYIDVCTWKKPKNGKIMNGVLPEWWELYDSDTKMPYYFNTVTQQTHWKLPEVMNVHPIPLSSGDDKFLRRKLGEYEDDNDEEVNDVNDNIVIDENKAEETVGKNWEQHEDPRTGYKYYLHRKTRKLTWSVIEAYKETMKEEDRKKDTSTKPSKPPPKIPNQSINEQRSTNPNTQPGPTVNAQNGTVKIPPSPQKKGKFPNSFVKYSNIKKTNVVYGSRKEPLPKLPPVKNSSQVVKKAPPPPIPKTNKFTPNTESSNEKSTTDCTNEQVIKNRPPSNSFSHQPNNENSSTTNQDNGNFNRLPSKSFSESKPKPSNPPPPVPKKVPPIPTSTQKQSSDIPSPKKSQNQLLSERKRVLPKRPSTKRFPKFTRVNTIGSTDARTIKKSIAYQPKSFTKIPSHFINDLEGVVEKGRYYDESSNNVENSTSNNEISTSPTRPVLGTSFSYYGANNNPSTPTPMKSKSFVNFGSSIKKDNISPRPTLPDQLRKQLNFFQLEGYAQQYFKNVKRGIFRRRVPIKQRLKWTKEKLKEPLLRLNKNASKKALKIFKYIQIYMGDRSPGIQEDERLKLVETLMSVGLNMAELRDEIYCQLCKQTTLNPHRESLKRGWSLINLIIQYFPPTKDLEPWVEQYLKEYETSEEDLKIYIAFSIRKLPSIARQGALLRTPDVNEIEHSLRAALRPPVFSASLKEINEAHQVDGSIPRILTALITRIKELNGHNTYQIFRITGGLEECTQLRIQLEKGNYDLSNIKDPHVPATVLKQWFRSLDDSIIPTELYWECLETVKMDSKITILDILRKLEPLNLRVLKYTIDYLKIFLNPENQKLTSMNVQSLAIIFGPTFVRCPSTDPSVILKFSQMEQKFIVNLIRNFPEYENI